MQSMSRRQAVARLFANLGVTAALEALPRASGILVLNYHRVGDANASPYDPGVFSASAEEFDRQVAYLKRALHLVTLDEVLWLLDHPKSLRRPEVLLTFDDGYRDNYEVAFPILRAHGVQATFFLVTSFVGSQRLPWWDTIAYVVRHSSAPEIVLSYPYSASFPLGPSVMQSLVGILHMYKSSAVGDPARFIAELSDRCGVVPPETAAGPVFLTWDEAREMVRGGMAIGSHTHSHQLLAKLDPAEQVQELAFSRATLSAQLGVSIRAVAFPVGSVSAFNEHSKAAAREAGYDCAFSYYGGFNRPDRTDRYNLLRESVDAQLSMERFRLRVVMLPRFGWAI
jgi:peptidoglycan/xylan/chitin deacetylase (PgdA/CDA1 family)